MPRSRDLGPSTWESSSKACLEISELERLATPSDYASSAMSRVKMPPA